MKKNPLIVSKLSDHGSIIHSKFYPTAHRAADVAEKKKYPSGYKQLKKAMPTLGDHELMGKMTKNGRIEVNAKFSKNAPEIAYHEKVEHKKYNKLRRKK